TNIQRWDRAGNWGRVNHNGVTGFVRLTDVVLLSHNNAADQSDRRAFVRRNSTIYQHPTIHSREMGSISRHDQLGTVRNWDRAGNWIEVRRDGRRIGFVRHADVSLVVLNSAQHTLRKRVTFTAATPHFRAASTAARSDGGFRSGQTVHAYAHNRSGTWLRAEVGGSRVFFRTTDANVSYHVRVTNNAELNSELERTLNRLVNDGMTKSQMRRAIYDDTVRQMVWAADNGTLESGWRINRALQALRTNRGNCFGYAARFGFLAQAIGDDATIMSGHIRGQGGPVRHGWVEITTRNGVFVYDPQMEQATGLSFYHMPRGRERAFYLR
ncbi:MAG: transglutaminase domain-containing protein, partial [Coriobacteriia bacterium]|nr:transglutaminase domain-containing protein [Coriobacteriia bacterium]